jgi:hypothetical protein
MMKIRTKSYIEKLLPELKPNSELMLMGIASAPILQNPLLCVRLSHSVIDVVCHGKIYILKQAIQLVLSRYCILHISYDVPVSLYHHKIRNANYLFSIQHNVFSAMLPILDSRCGNSHAFAFVACQTAND